MQCSTDAVHFSPLLLELQCITYAGQGRAGMLQHTACSKPTFPAPATISHAFLGASMFSSGVVKELQQYPVVSTLQHR